MMPASQHPIDNQAAWREQALRELLANRNLPIEEKFRMVEEMAGFAMEIRKANLNSTAKRNLRESDEKRGQESPGFAEVRNR